MNSNQKRILFVVNTPWFFLSHRLPLATAAKSLGYDVHIATSGGPEINKIMKEGFVHHIVPFKRSTVTLFSNVIILFSLIKLFRSVKPDIIHLVTIKPVIFGGIAARIIGINSVVAAISGLGTVFIDDSPMGSFRRFIIMKLYKAAFKQKRCIVIFQNHADRKIFLDKDLISPSDIRVIRGSGVKISDYPYIAEPGSSIRVVMAARLLKDKGIYEFIEAAKLVKACNNKIIFCLLGEPDPENKSSISQSAFDQLKIDGSVEIFGYCDDIAHQYAKANIVCLPSYREGLPKSLIEAAACGRAVVTTDVPGCRDAIIPGETGLLCSVKDPASLASAIQTLIDNPHKRHQMGKAGRNLAESEFAIERIIEQHIDIYKDLAKSTL